MIQVTERCLCGHLREKHVTMGCLTCVSNYIFYYEGRSDALCKEFRLDNLKLIEDLARIKKLVR